MGHPGKHIIDPDTGLCEICDKDAIRDIRQGRMPPKQVYYSKHDGGQTHRSNNGSYYADDRYDYDVDDPPTPRRIRRVVRPAPAVRSRRVINDDPDEQPVIVRRKIIRRAPPLPPSDDDVVQRSAPRSKQYYYVDRDGQMFPQDYTPPPEPPRRYIVQTKNSPPERRVRVIRRHARTPSPVNDVRSYGPRRQINSDTEILDRHQRVKRDDERFESPPPKKFPEMYHIASDVVDDFNSSLDSPLPRSPENISPLPQLIDHDDEYRRQPKFEPVSRKNPNEHTPRRNHAEPAPPRKSHIEPEPAIVKRVYRKPAPGRTVPPNDKYNSNENFPRIVRNEKSLSSTRRFASTPPLTQRTNRSPEPNKTPSVYYIRPVDAYR